MKRMILSELSILLLLSLEPLFSQSGSVVDVLPLAVGNQWVYNYSDSQWDIENGTTRIDSGSVKTTIISRIDSAAFSQWGIQEHFLLTVILPHPGGPDTRYQLEYLDTAGIVEMFTLDHPLYGSGSVFDFPVQPDSLAVHRYRTVDSSGIAATVITQPWPNFAKWSFAFGQSKGVQSSGFNRSPGLSRYSRMATVVPESTLLMSVSPPGSPRGQFSLLQNYPNPFNPSTEVSFVIQRSTMVTLRIYDVLGRLVTTLVDERKGPGEYKIKWNGGGAATGVYYYRLVAGDFVETKKMIFMK